MPRLVRRQPLAERIQSYLNPWDFLLWLSESIDGYDWDQLEKEWGLTLGVTLNLIFLVARANSGSSGSEAIDDVFGDDDGLPWLSWFVREETSSIMFAQFEANICSLFTGVGRRSHLDIDLWGKCILHLLPQAILPLV